MELSEGEFMLLTQTVQMVFQLSIDLVVAVHLVPQTVHLDVPLTYVLGSII